MLLGIHEDTGSLTFPSATAYDAEAAAWLMASGADLEVVNQFLSRTLEPEQRALLGQLTASLEVWDVNGQQIAVGVAAGRRVRRLGRRALALRGRGPGLPRRDRGRRDARPHAGGGAQPALRGRRGRRAWRASAGEDTGRRPRRSSAIRRLAEVLEQVRAALLAEVSAPLRARRRDEPRRAVAGSVGDDARGGRADGPLGTRRACRSSRTARLSAS